MSASLLPFYFERAMAIDEQFLTTADELQAAVSELRARGIAVTGEEPWDASATEYIRHLAAHLVHADRHFAPREYALLAAFFADGTTYHEEYELARHVALQSPDFFDRCPGFLTAASRSAPDIAMKVRECIRTLVQTLMLADGFASVREEALARQYLQLEGMAPSTKSE